MLHGSCATPAPVPMPENEAVLSVDNPTLFTVYFDGEQKVEKKSAGVTVSLAVEDATLTGGFDIFYEIPLSGTVRLFCKGDHKTIRKEQTAFTVSEPVITENYGTYIKITNKVNNAVSFYTGSEANPGWEQQGDPRVGNHMARTNRREFSKGETPVFMVETNSRYDSYFIRDGRKNIPLILPPVVERNYLYSFEYSGGNAELVDARPLSRVGEKGWVRTIAETDTALQIVRNPGTDIMAFASSTESGLVLYTASSGGETRALSRIKLPNFSITQALKTGGSFSTVSGYIQNDALYIPVLQKLDENGLAAAGLPPSGQSDRRSAYFLTLAEDGGGTLLAAGGADSGVNSAASYQAYIRALRKDGFTPLWELGPAEFDAAVSGAVKCGEVGAAAFDEVRGVWVITGKNIEFDRLRNPVTGSYIARIDPGGNILGIDTSYKGLVFNKLLIDDEGGCYLAGEEETHRASYAVILKLTSDGTELWRSRNRPGADSFYQDGLLDDENRQLVLAGTMLAEDLTGTGGTPFIEGINAATGETIWREALTDSRFGGTALVTGIEKAPFYGFVLALSGIKDAYFAPPFMLARLNARGKF